MPHFGYLVRKKKIGQGKVGEFGCLQNVATISAVSEASEQQFTKKCVILWFFKPMQMTWIA
jgi:hypothetical protein